MRNIVRTDYMANTPLWFRCNDPIRDLADGSYSSKDFPGPLVLNGTEGILESHFFAQLRMGPVAGVGRRLVMDPTRAGILRDHHFDGDGPFHYAIGNPNSTHSELWFASFIVHDIGIKLKFLNEYLWPIQIAPENNSIVTTLSVKWFRSRLVRYV